MSAYSMSGDSGNVIGGMYESENDRLQKEVDEFTMKLEHEKSHLTIIEEQIRVVKAELLEKQGKIKAATPSELQVKQTKIKTQGTQRNVASEQLRLNMTQTKNQVLRRDIDMLRKEVSSSKSECTRYDKKIKKAKKEAEIQNQDYQAVSKIAEETNNQIIALQAKHQEEKDRFESEIITLQIRLKEKDEVIEFEDKTMKPDPAEAGAGQEFSNPIVILKMRLQRITEANKEKRKLMDQYLRNVKVIEDAFDQIKTATGISNNDEIVTTFIKAQEQNYSLYNYVHMLNTETDQLEESNQGINDQINKILSRCALGDAEKQNLRDSLQDEIKMLQEEIEKQHNDSHRKKQGFIKMQQSVSNMVDMFKQSKFFLVVANKMDYQSNINFTENNIVSYLAELEEYISSLITYTAFKKDDPNAPISSIPLENLNAKDHNKKVMTIEPPTDYQINTQEQAPISGDVLGDIISAKELFAQFNNMVDTKQLTFLTGGKNNAAAAFNKEEDELSLN